MARNLESPKLREDKVRRVRISFDSVTGSGHSVTALVYQFGDQEVTRRLIEPRLPIHVGVGNGEDNLLDLAPVSDAIAVAVFLANTGGIVVRHGVERVSRIADEPWCHLIHWSAGDLHHERKPPGTYDPIVAEHLAGSAFLAQEAEAPTGTVLRTFPDGVRTWRGTAVNSDLASRFHAKEVLYLPLTTSMLDAHFLGFTKPGRTADDLVLGEVVARLAISSIEQFFHTRQLPPLAAAEERVRLARNLHDGVLLSLTAAALQVESVLRLLETHPTAARDQLRKIERLITEEQRDLRFFVSEFRPTGGSPLDGNERLEPILQSMTERLAAIWNLRVSLHVAPSNNAVPRRLFEEIYHLVREALVNVARHAEATEARVLLGVREDRVQIVVHDNGRGFPFHGHYDHASLMALRRGPASLKDRLRVLGGTIAIDSHVTGARLHLSIPLGPAE